jgi:ribose 5-phosphate isomerase A
MATSKPSDPASQNAAPIAGTHPSLSLVEESKRRAAYRAVEDHFHPEYTYIGIGSGSTVVYVVEAIASKGRDVTSRMIFIPTGEQATKHYRNFPPFAQG